MPFVVLTGSEDFAAETQKQAARHGSRLIPVYYSSAVDEGFIAIFDGDKRVTKPIPIREGWGAEVRKALVNLGADLAAMRPEAAPPPAKVEKPAKGKPAKAVAKVEVPTLEQVTKQIMDIQGKTIENFVEIGRWLGEAKKLVSHGEWLNYLEETLDFGIRNAQLYMRLFEKCGSNTQTYAYLTLSKIAILIEAPDDSLPELIELAHRVSVRELRAAVHQARLLAESPPVITLPLAEPSLPTPGPIAEPAVMPEPEPTEPLKIPPVVPPTPPQEAAETKVVNGRTIVIYGERPEAQKHAIEQFVGAIKEQFEVSPTSLLEEKSEEIPAKPVAPRKAKSAPLNAEAKKFNTAAKKLLGVTATTLLVFSEAKGSVEGGGDGFGLNQVYALQDALVAIQQQLARVVGECSRLSPC